MDIAAFRRTHRFFEKDHRAIHSCEKGSSLPFLKIFALFLPQASALLLVLMLLLVGCTGPSASGPGASQEVTVFAATSLIDAFQEMKAAFEASSPEARVFLNLAGTPTLRIQIEQGARADIFASADAMQMAQAVSAGVIEGAPVVFARNQLVVISPARGSRVQELSDLAQPGIKLVLGLPNVPVGAYAREALFKMESAPDLGSGFASRVLNNLASLETNVRQVVTKVALGEADAGITYASDVTGQVAEKLQFLPIPDRYNVEAEYPMAIVKGAPHPQLARKFLQFVLSPTGQAVLARHGFQRVTP